MQISLRESDLNSCGLKLRVNRRMQIVDRSQPAIQLRQVATDDEVESAVPELFEGDRGDGIFEHIGMRVDNLQHQRPRPVGIGAVGDADVNHQSIRRIA